MPRTKPLMPLFEVISNAIHAINEAKKHNQLSEEGLIKIKLIRNGDDETLKSLESIDDYPIRSILISDNGIGLNDENLNYFIETDTDHKLEMGGKGVGRFVCLKAFNKLVVKSYFNNNGSSTLREFEFRNTKIGFHEPKEFKVKTKKIGTEVLLSEFKEEYQKNSPKDIF